MLESVLQAVVAHAGWLVAASVLSMLLGLIVVPALIIRVPADYFLYAHRHALSMNAGHPLARLILAGGKNLLGGLFVLVGLVLLFLPGQGLLTLIAGLMIMNYPGKYEFERWLVRRPHVLPAMNWLRRKYGRAPLERP